MVPVLTPSNREQENISILTLCDKQVLVTIAEALKPAC